jgi:hypothetical protein
MTRTSILPATIVMGLFVGCIGVVVAERTRNRSDSCEAVTEFCNQVRAEALIERIS